MIASAAATKRAAASAEIGGSSTRATVSGEALSQRYGRSVSGCVPKATNCCPAQRASTECGLSMPARSPGIL